MTLTRDHRDVLTAVADLLIPQGESVPSASQVALAGTPIDQALSYRPDLSEAFIAALDACMERDPEAALDRLAATEPQLFAALTLLTAGAYLASREALDAMNYTAPPQPLIDDTDTYVDLLANVFERGFDIH